MDVKEEQWLMDEENPTYREHRKAGIRNNATNQESYSSTGQPQSFQKRACAAEAGYITKMSIRSQIIPVDTPEDEHVRLAKIATHPASLHLQYM